MAKKIKPVAYKATLQTIARYHKQQKAGKIIQSTTIEKYEKSIKRYLTKSGTLKKDLTQRQVQNFNRKVEAFKKDKYANIESIKDSTKRSADTFVENHAGATKVTAMNVRSMLTMANNKKVKIDSDKIVELAYEMDENKNVSNVEYEKIFAEYLKRIDKGIPFEAQAYVSTDDVVKVMQELTEIMQSLETTSDKNKMYALIRKDATIDEIRQYFASEGIKKAQPIKTRRGVITITKEKETLQKGKRQAVKTSKGKISTTQRKKKLNGKVR